jgi:hypothetical protein
MAALTLRLLSSTQLVFGGASLFFGNAKKKKRKVIVRLFNNAFFLSKVPNTGEARSGAYWS